MLYNLNLIRTAKMTKDLSSNFILAPTLISYHVCSYIDIWLLLDRIGPNANYQRQDFWRRL